MNYDLYCYRSRSGTPDRQEAESIVDAINQAEEEGTPLSAPDVNLDVKDKLVATLRQHNPRLEPFIFDYKAIAESDGISEEQARRRFQYVELNPPEGDLAIQLTVHSDHVFITVPYWYEPDVASKVFSDLVGYLAVIRQASGFFAYDPQTGSAFDPGLNSLDPHAYNRTMQQIPDMIEIAKNAKQKPWWKFW